MNREAELEQENRELKAQLEQLKLERKRYLQGRAVIALLSSSDNHKIDRETCSRITGQEFCGNRFVLCSFADRSSQPGDRDEMAIWESLNSTYYYVLCDLITPCFSEMNAFMPANDNGFIYCLVNLPDSVASEEYADTFRRICQAVNERTERAEGFRFHMMVTDIGYGLSQLPMLRGQLDTMREYYEIVGDSAPEFLLYSSIAYTSQEEIRAASNRETNEQFSDYINRGDFDLARQFFHNKILPSIVGPMTSATTIRFRIAGLLDYMIQTLTRASYELGIEQTLDEIHAAELLLSVQSVEEVEKQMDYILDRLQKHWNEAGNAGQNLALRARKFVDENYSNPELNVSMVADFLGVSSSYITRVFRSSYQVRMLDYIQQTRIRSAKQLLSSGLSLKEIAEQSGYGAQINMIRAFKRLEGKTPSEFETDRGREC